MKKCFVISLLFVGCFGVLSFGKPMESITNYNVLLVHGAYGSDQGYGSKDYPEAYYAGGYLGDATLGGYGSGDRITGWLSKKIFEEPKYDSAQVAVRNSYVFNWRCFTNPANSSVNNAHELGDRTWNLAEGSVSKYGKRRALVEEAQEVKADYTYFDKTLNREVSLYGQVALDSIRKNPDLYRQMASRYILIGHSMGGVVSREYVQNSNYYHGDVDKIITLDSPHEGTGALNMQLDMVDAGRTAVEGALGSVTLMSSVALAAWIAGSDLSTLTIALLGFSGSMGAAALNLGSGALIKGLFLEDYHRDDPLVCYVDPNANDNPDCNGEDNILTLKSLNSNPDSMPMFRLMAGKNSMTFTDPKLGARNLMSLFVPDAITVPWANVAAQISGGESFSANYANAITGLVVGFLGGVNVQAHGSSLVETSGGLGENTALFKNPLLDKKTYEFNAAYNVSENWTSDVMVWALAAGGAALVADCLPFPYSKAVKAGLAIAASVGIAGSVLTAATSGILDLSFSHMYPLYAEHIGEWKTDEENTYSGVRSGSSSYRPYIMEDFLYEKPFVNLLMGDAATLDSLKKDQSATLNKSCYYLGELKDQKCVVGLFGGSRKDSSVAAMKPIKDLAPLRFKSASDWSDVGVKVDR
ncbi:MAG: hypothetical protein HUK21_11485, partial [Fibrobacteraceae bacterium]|nr:hypothetical protein [Fibrobacteraceae bacterium]